MGKKLKRPGQVCSAWMTVLLAALMVSCSGQDFGFLQPTPEDLCKCLPAEPDILDYRHIAKHVPISNVAPQEVSVETILTWPQDVFYSSGRSTNWARASSLPHRRGVLTKRECECADCDVSMEISQTADKSSSRMTVETPVDSEYCSARQTLQAQLKQHGFRLDSQHGGELPQALPVDVVGMAFEDFEHDRGNVATLWELHPAIVTPH